MGLLLCLVDFTVTVYDRCSSLAGFLIIQIEFASVWSKCEGTLWDMNTSIESIRTNLQLCTTNSKCMHSKINLLITTFKKFILKNKVYY